MFNAKNLGKRLLDEDGKNEKGNQPPAKQAKITPDDNNQADIQAAEVNPHLFARLPDEVMVNILSHFVEPPTLNAFAQTNRRHYELISGGEKGDGALEYNIPFFNQPLTWREMPNQFNDKAAAQWKEIQKAVERKKVSPQELKFNRPAINIKEYNESEGLLNEINITIIINAINDHRKFINNDRGGTLDLSYCSLTRFPLKQLFEDKEIKTLFLNLTSLRLTGNQLFGPIPKELGQLINLKGLKLNDNNLSGIIPSELGRLSKLKHLTLSNNKLSGPIPPELGQLSNLESLFLDWNHLNGSIPLELKRLANLKFLQLNLNNLSGHIPHELGQLINLKYLLLHDNNLSGIVPSELERLSELNELWLSMNQLSGPVPERLAQRFPHLVNSEGHIAGQQAVDDEQANQRRLRP